MMFVLLIGMLGYCVCDFLLMMQMEVGEVVEFFGVGKGGFFIMLYKCNLVGCVMVFVVVMCMFGLVSMLLVVLLQEYECVFGGWQV